MSGKAKAKLNISRHKVAFEEASTLFEDSLSIT
ncbi:MAG TPA: BrnT family toxin, partial [Spirochaetes bacterium]|nr:BrnT family toxin [Spirochaetota bacterium]